MARIIAGAFLALHGVAHAAGFAAAWKLVTSAGVPYTTTILNGAVDLGDAGIRLMGILWLAAGAGMVAAGILVLRGSSRAATAVVAATGASLAACVAGLPAAAIGLLIDLAIVAALAAAVVRRELFGTASA